MLLTRLHFVVNSDFYCLVAAIEYCYCAYIVCLYDIRMYTPTLKYQHNVFYISSILRGW